MKTVAQLETELKRQKEKVKQFEKKIQIAKKKEEVADIEFAKIKDIIKNNKVESVDLTNLDSYFEKLLVISKTLFEMDSDIYYEIKNMIFEKEDFRETKVTFNGKVIGEILVIVFDKDNSFVTNRNETVKLSMRAYVGRYCFGDSLNKLKKFSEHASFNPEARDLLAIGIGDKTTIDDIRCKIMQQNPVTKYKTGFCNFVASCEYDANEYIELCNSRAEVYTESAKKAKQELEDLKKEAELMGGK